jgi:hypothetical protein
MIIGLVHLCLPVVPYQRIPKMINCFEEDLVSSLSSICHHPPVVRLSSSKPGNPVIVLNEAQTLKRPREFVLTSIL